MSKKFEFNSIPMGHGYDPNYRFQIAQRASAKNKEEEKKKKKRSRGEFVDQALKDITLELDLFVDNIETVEAKTFKDKFQKLLSGDKIKEEFEIIATVEVLLRGLKKIKFKNVGQLVIDKEEIYNDPDNWNDINKVIDILWEHNKKTKGEIDLFFCQAFDINDVLTKVYVLRTHKKKVSAISVIFKEVKESEIKTFIKYLKNNLEVEYVNY